MRTPAGDSVSLNGRRKLKLCFYDLVLYFSPESPGSAIHSNALVKCPLTRKGRVLKRIMWLNFIRRDELLLGAHASLIPIHHLSRSRRGHLELKNQSISH